MESITIRSNQSVNDTVKEIMELCDENPSARVFFRAVAEQLSLCLWEAEYDPTAMILGDEFLEPTFEEIV